MNSSERYSRKFVKESDLEITDGSFVEEIGSDSANKPETTSIKDAISARTQKVKGGLIKVIAGEPQRQDDSLDKYKRKVEIIAQKAYEIGLNDPEVRENIIEICRETSEGAVENISHQNDLLRIKRLKEKNEKLGSAMVSIGLFNNQRDYIQAIKHGGRLRLLQENSSLTMEEIIKNEKDYQFDILMKALDLWGTVLSKVISVGEIASEEADALIQEKKQKVRERVDLAIMEADKNIKLKATEIRKETQLEIITTDTKISKEYIVNQDHLIEGNKALNKIKGEKAERWGTILVRSLAPIVSAPVEFLRKTAKSIGDFAKDTPLGFAGTSTILIGVTYCWINGAWGPIVPTLSVGAALFLINGVVGERISSKKPKE